MRNILTAVENSFPLMPHHVESSGDVSVYVNDYVEILKSQSERVKESRIETFEINFENM